MRLILLLLMYVVNRAQGIIREVAVDIHRNITLPCGLNTTKEIAWAKFGRDNDRPRFFPNQNNALSIVNAERKDAGIYVCYIDNDVPSEQEYKIKLNVRTPPPALENVIVKSSSIIALILWEVNATGGYPIINFTAEYRLAGSDHDWLPISPNHIPPNARQIDVYKLQPNTTYDFRIWASNVLGKGVITTVNSTTTPEYKEEELARRMLAGVDTFDTRIWAVAVGIVIGTLIILSMGTCYILYYECRKPTGAIIEQEVIELVPNIILNPGFDGMTPGHKGAAEIINIEHKEVDNRCSYPTESIALTSLSTGNRGNGV